MTKAATPPCFTPRILSASLSTIRLYTQTFGLRASDLDTTMHGVEAGSVRASQCYIKNMQHTWPPPCWPWMLGWVKTSRNALKTSLRGQTRGSVCVGSDLSYRNIMTKFGIGFTQETAEVRSPLLSPYRSLGIAVTFYTRTLCVA